MTRSVHPAPPYYLNGFLVCPDCGEWKWGSGLCLSCGAKLYGPRRKSRVVDPGILRHWFIGRDGSAQLFLSDQP